MEPSALGCGNPQAIASLKPRETVLDLPQELAADLAAHCGCVAGAASVHELETMLREAGFTEIRVRPKDASREFIRSWIPGRKAADYVVSATIEAVKPACACCASTCCE